MHQSANRVTRAKPGPKRPRASWTIYPANGPEIDSAFPGQYIAFLEGIQRGKPIWKIVAHGNDMPTIHQVLDQLPKKTREKVLLWYIYAPDEVVERSLLIEELLEPIRIRGQQRTHTYRFHV